MPTTTPVTVTQTHPQWSVGVRDLLQSLVAAIITPVLPIILPVLSGGSFTFNKNQILAAAALGFVSWLSIKFVKPAQTIVTGTTPGTTMSLTAPATGTKTTATAVNPTTPIVTK